MSAQRLVAAALLALSPILAVGQGVRPQKWSGRVQVRVDGDDQAVALVKSYVNREFRGLGDVIVSDAEPEYFLWITVGAISGGYAISVLEAQHFNTDGAKALLKQGDTKPDTIDLVTDLLKTAYFNLGQGLSACTSSELDKAIKQVIANFDVRMLQPSRNIDQAVKHTLSPKKDELPN